MGSDSKTSMTQGQVIHVAFGQSARAAEQVVVDREPDLAALFDQAQDDVRVEPRAPDPVAAVYTRAEVARIFGVDSARLRAWERAGLVRPSAEASGETAYSFQDLVSVRTTRDLVGKGVPVARIRRAVDALRKTLPGATPLAELRIISDGKTLAVRKGNSTFDPVTGQLLLDFDLGTLREDVVRALPARPVRRDAKTAYDWFLEGCRLDAEDATRASAEAAYRKAIRLDPTLATAYVNLGTIRLLAGALGDAEALYRKAIALDESLAEAYYNLGFIKLEARMSSEAIDLLARSVELDPAFADAHFNLAVALQDAGRSSEALPHWAAYLDLEPDGRYAAIAKTHVR
jgi:tetratricopeptide (TPR) repeat protein